MKPNLKAVIEKLDLIGRKALDNAISYTVNHHHAEVKSEHLLQALLQQNTQLQQLLQQKCGLAVESLLRHLDQDSESTKFSQNISSAPTFSPLLVSWLMDSWLFASTNWNQRTLSSAALIAYLFVNERSVFPPHIQCFFHADSKHASTILASVDATFSSNSTDVASSALAKYTRNITLQARQGELDPVIGRELEIRQIIDVLLRRRQNNPMLTGEPGVGKTALIEGLAQRITEGSVPNRLKSMEVMTLDLGLLQAGASVKGEFEQRLQTLLQEANAYPQPIILFIDEAHMLIGAGGNAGQNDVANLLKPALARGEQRIIAATTWSEYKKYFEKDAALTRRFQVVKVAEPNITMATAMLRAMAHPMAKHHNIRILESAIHAAVTLSQRYLVGRQLPDKSVSLLDTACARVVVSQTQPTKEIEVVTAELTSFKSEYSALLNEGVDPTALTTLQHKIAALKAQLSTLQQEWQLQCDLVQRLQVEQDPQQKASLNTELAERHKTNAMVFECVDATSVADVLSDWTGIPLGRMLEMEQQQLDSLCTRLAERVLGQSQALMQISQQMRISRAGLSCPLKPTGVYLLAGPSGTGKTETALALADFLFGGRQSLVTINMTEYQEAHSIAGLKGSPPGYVGYGQGGILTEAVRRNPYSVILLDEVDRAHPDVLELFYQIFDKGMLEDSEGQIVNFRNSLIIMTSNLASQNICQAISDGNSELSAICRHIRPEFDQVLGPALMGRITLIPYFPLSQATLSEIVTLKLDEVRKRYQKAQGEEALLTWSSQVVDWIIEHCQFQQSGARDIDQVLNQHILPHLAAEIFSKKQPQTLKLDISKNSLVLRSRKPKS